MFGFVIFKRKDNQKNSLQKPSQINSEEKQEKIIVDIDYDELADAIVKANNQIELNKKEDELNNLAKIKEQKDEVLGNTSALRRVLKLWVLKEKDAKKLSGTSILFPLLNATLLYVTEILFYIACVIFALSAIIITIAFVYGLLNSELGWFDVAKTIITYVVSIVLYVLSFFTCMTLGRLFRIAKLEMETINNYNMQMSLFGALSSFAAVVVAVISLFVQR